MQVPLPSGASDDHPRDMYTDKKVTEQSFDISLITCVYKKKQWRSGPRIYDKLTEIDQRIVYCSILY